MTETDTEKMAQALRIIRQHVAADPSAVAASIIATCDEALLSHASARAQPASVADGWVMVPREPTEGMLRAEDDAVPTDDAVRKDPYAWGRASWKAFLAAAPQSAKECDR